MLFVEISLCMESKLGRYVVHTLVLSDDSLHALNGDSGRFMGCSC